MDRDFHQQELLNDIHESEARKHGVTKVVEWRLTRATEQRFEELCALHHDCAEGSDEQVAIEGDIRSLPGFPPDAGPDTFTRRVLMDIQH